MSTQICNHLGAHDAAVWPVHAMLSRWSAQDFAGGIMVFTLAQMRAVNGYGTHFWGWGREDDK